jgi:hypothetical protein
VGREEARDPREDGLAIGGIEMLDPGDGADPGPLAAGELAGVGLHRLERVDEGVRAVHDGLDVAIADRLHRLQLGAVAALAQIADLAQQPLGDHRLGPGGDALVQRLAAGIDGEMQHPERSIAEAVGLAHAGGRATGLLEDLEGADRAPGVVRMDLVGGVGVELGQSPVEPSGIALGDGPGMLGLEARTQPGRRLPRLDQTVEEGPDVEPGPAHQHDEATPGVDRGGRGPRLLCIASRAVGLVGVDDVEEVVRDAQPLFERGLRRADVHEAEDLHRVRVHDLAIETQRDLEGERALARRRRTGHDDDRRSFRCSLLVRHRRKSSPMPGPGIASISPARRAARARDPSAV